MSDEEYVEKVRKSVLFWDRFRFWAFPVQLGILVALMSLCAWGIHAFAGLMAGPAPAGFPQGIWQGFSFGAIAGLVLAFLFGKIIDGFTHLRPGLRTERLLVEYHDRLVSTGRGDCQLEVSTLDGRGSDPPEARD
jgi:hypothetical protein